MIHTVTIETPKFSFIKRKDNGSIDYISPFPCPFNYGSVPGTLSGDGDREDAVVLGKRLKMGVTLEVPVVAVVRFVDKGEDDPKYICSYYKITNSEKMIVVGFFKFYAFAKGLLNKLRGKKGKTKFAGIDFLT